MPSECCVCIKVSVVRKNEITTQLTGIIPCCVWIVLLRIGSRSNSAKIQDTVFADLHEEEFKFVVGTICTIFGNAISQFSQQTFLLYMIVLVIVE